MTRRGRWLAAGVLATAGACSFPGHSNPGTQDGPDNPDQPDGRVDATLPDARYDAMPADPCLWGWNPAEFSICDVPDPESTGHIDLTTGTWTLSSDTGILTSDTGSETQLGFMVINGIGVVSVDHLNIVDNAIVRGVGSRPLAIVSWHGGTISGTIDVSSSFDTSNPFDGPGAGANSPACPIEGSGGPDEGANDNGGDGGSGGGGFGGDGGDGGDGAGGNAESGDGGAGRQLPARIEGGCAGADAESGTSGFGGSGGGAILIVARGTLTISGVIHAGGQGGGGATGGGEEAGGGGGSGGMIKIEAGVVDITQDATLAANGAQGGGGNKNGDASRGQNGRPDDTEAVATNKEGNGGNGGGGGFEARPAGASASQAGDGGGGGGGGVGFIVYRGHPTVDVDSSATMSPPGATF